jgi:hypothetical protein
VFHPFADTARWPEPDVVIAQPPWGR